MEGLKALKLKRTGLRTSFTKTANILKSELVKKDFSVDLLRDKFTKLENVHLEVKDLDDRILDLLSETSEEEIAKEIENREVYSDDFITLTRQINEKLVVSEEVKVDTRSNDGSSNGCNKIKQYRLPKIELKKFDGELINWLPFWSQFEKIHNDSDLYESDKFSYLIQRMKHGSRAKEFIESYPVTSENYDKAVVALKERFGKPELLVEVYVRELIKLIISNVKADNKDKLPLDKLYDKIEAHLRALESLGLESNENTSWLFPMVESCLTEDVLRAWQRSSLFNQPETTDISRLSNLMKFLKSEVEGEERLKLARSGLDNGKIKEGYHDKTRNETKSKFRKQANVPTATGFLTTKDHACIFCCKMHDSKNCFEARSLTLKERISKVKEKKCCLKKCLEPFHMANSCKKFVRCFSCGKAHSIILCPEINNKVEPQVEKPIAEHLQSTTAGQACTSEVALMTLRVKVAGVDKIRNVRVLLDCGSQKSYIVKSLAIELGLPIVSKENIAHTLFGGARTDPKLHNKYRVKLCSATQHEFPDLEFDFLDQDVICGDIPCIQKGPILEELKRNKIWLSDLGSRCSQIEMLIGSDIYGKILTGLVRQLKGGLTAVRTKLRWTVCGKFEDFPTPTEQSASNLCVSFAVRDFNISDLWNLETIGIKDSGQNLTKIAEEEIAQEQFSHSLTRNEDGRYRVGLPWLVHNEELPSNRHVAEKRLFSVTRKLKSLNKYENYDEIFKEWMDEGIIEEVPNNELDLKGHYLPHHPVFKPNSVTTKIRPVFDASCKVGRSPSLNDCLFKGPNLIEDIPSILLKFRENCIGVTSDIKRAFLQIELRKEDRDFLRFLWWEKDNIVKVLRHTRVVFGVTSSPFLLGAVIAFHLSQVPPEQSFIAQKLEKSLYVDNCVTSVDNKEELINFMKYSTDILAKAKMDLRMWTFGPINKDIGSKLSNLDTETALENPVSVLGVLWDREKDSLSISIKNEPISENLSKREILSLTQTIYDPLGFLSPVVLQAKLMLQEIWAEKLDWDAPLSEQIKRTFFKWYNGLGTLADLKLPRRIGFGEKSFWELHIFCDASQQAYATVIFLRCEHNREIFISFVAAKSRVAPLKTISIPRLELMACVLGARLSKYVTEALSLEDNTKYFWTDSTTALSWIKKNDLWGTFVGNRVKEICTLTKSSQWAYVQGQCNPADLPSRGCSPLGFKGYNWWNGPAWLKGPKDSWPKLEVKPDETLVLSELGKGANLVVNINTDSKETIWYEKFSKFSKMIRVLGWVKRFISNCLKQNIKKESVLSASEIQEAKTSLLSLVQMESFPGTAESVNGLLTVRDQSGLLRLKTKIIEREDSYSFKYPILLPSKHKIVDCLVMEYHENHSHAGTQALMAILREEYWIISSRRTIKRIINKCVRCKRFTVKSPSTDPIHLPLDRVRDASAFEIVGIDLCGPLILRDKSKSWVVLFTCAIYRAVHLELVTSISTESFLQAFRRFVCRRGRPSTVYSDNGTNFTGASALMKKIDWEKVIAIQTVKPIQWKFIPPTAAWWGGWWERLIRSTKELLVRVLGRSSVTYEELYTILCEVESVLNNRPLTYISDDVSDLTPLTPSMFLQDSKQTSGLPEFENVERDKLLARHRLCKELIEQFRSRFRKEYLAHLVQRAGRGTCHIEVGDIVMIGSDNLKRLNWPIARVQELVPGRDGRVRVAKLKTQNGELLRPVRRLYPLEVQSSVKGLALPPGEAKGGSVAKTTL